MLYAIIAMSALVIFMVTSILIKLKRVIAIAPGDYVGMIKVLDTYVSSFNPTIQTPFMGLVWVGFFRKMVDVGLKPLMSYKTEFLEIDIADKTTIVDSTGSPMTIVLAIDAKVTWSLRVIETLSPKEVAKRWRSIGASNSDLEKETMEALEEALGKYSSSKTFAHMKKLPNDRCFGSINATGAATDCMRKVEQAGYGGLCEILSPKILSIKYSPASAKIKEALENLAVAQTQAAAAKILGDVENAILERKAEILRKAGGRRAVQLDSLGGKVTTYVEQGGGATKVI